MKALTLWQPWASLVAAGYKTVETRSWAPPANLVGERIAIHASVRMPKKDDMEMLKPLRYESSSLWDGYEFDRNGRLRATPAIPLGVVLATARLVAVKQVLTVGFVEPGGLDFDDGLLRAFCADQGFDTYTRWTLVDKFGDFSPGRWLWELDDVRPVRPPARAVGHQKLWNWTPRGE